MLKRIQNGHPVAGPVVCVVMDGVGIGKGGNDNNSDHNGDAVHNALTPTLDTLRRNPFYLPLNAHGTSVGMPNDDDMGNSEVGHNALGAGRIVSQGAKLVAEAVASGDIFLTPAWASAMERGASRGAIHFIGLLSDGNVHSHINHLLAMLRKCAAQGCQRVYVHVLLDGRDVERMSCLKYLAQLQATLDELNRQEGCDFAIASGGGRMTTTLDRYGADWGMVERGFNCHVHGQGRSFSSAMNAVEVLRGESPNIGDQDLPCFVIHRNGKPIAPIQDGDAVIAFNFRGDRIIELCQAFEDDVFMHFNRGTRPEIFFCGITSYDGDAHIPTHYLVEPPHIEHSLGELLCNEKVRQFACSETQKFGHVTYFWNGNRTGYFDEKLEFYQEVPSYQPPFEERPEMRAKEITDALITQLPHFDFLRINLPNGDMIGHTGDYNATKHALTVVDHSVARICSAVKSLGGAVLITADHGNADDMFERNKQGVIKIDHNGVPIPKVSHSLNQVPFYLSLCEGDAKRWTLNAASPKRPQAEPGLGHVASTLAQLLGFQTPDFYQPSLIKELS